MCVCCLMTSSFVSQILPDIQTLIYMIVNSSPTDNEDMVCVYCIEELCIEIHNTPWYVNFVDYGTIIRLSDSKLDHSGRKSFTTSI